MDAALPLLFANLATMLMAALVRVPPQAPEVLADGSILLRRDERGRRRLAVGAALLALLGCVGMVLPLALGSFHPELLALALTSLASLWFAWMLWRERETTVLLDDAGVWLRSGGGQRMLAWADVRGIRFSALGRSWWLRGESGRRLRVSTILAGGDHLLRMLRTHVPPERWRRWRFEVERFQKFARLQRAG